MVIPAILYLPVKAIVILEKESAITLEAKILLLSDVDPLDLFCTIKLSYTVTPGFLMLSVHKFEIFLYLGIESQYWILL